MVERSPNSYDRFPPGDYTRKVAPRTARLDDVVEHKEFGLGVVVEEFAPSAVTVMFAGSKRVNCLRSSLTVKNKVKVHWEAETHAPGAPDAPVAAVPVFVYEGNPLDIDEYEDETRHMIWRVLFLVLLTVAGGYVLWSMLPAFL